MDQKLSDNDFAINFHKQLDKKDNLNSPNQKWPLFLIEYYNKKEIKKNENEKNRLI